MLKRAVILNICSFGSTGAVARAQHEALLAQGVESWFAFAYGASDGIENAIVFGSKWGRRLHDRLSSLTGMQGHYSRISTRRLIRRLKEIRPDLVQLHNLHGNYLHIPMLVRYLQKSGCRIVVTLHDCWLFTGKCPHYTQIGCYRWKEACGNCPQLARYPRSWLFDRTAQLLAEKKRWLAQLHPDAVVAVSSWLAEEARSSYLSKYPVTYIYNGIDTSVFQPTASKLRLELGLEGKFIILSAADTWTESKGLGLLSRLAPLLPTNARLVLVGLRKEQCAGLPAQIIPVERLQSAARMAQLYSMADCYLSLSMEETFGMTVVEAMASGTPAIVMNTTACPETVNAATGIVIDAADSLRQASAAIERIQQAGDMTSACRERAVALFSKQRMQAEYLRLYHAVTEDANATKNAT